MADIIATIGYIERAPGAPGGSADPFRPAPRSRTTMTPGQWNQLRQNATSWWQRYEQALRMNGIPGVGRILRSRTGDKYVYWQYPDGAVAILEGPAHIGKSYAAGSRAAKNVETQFGKYREPKGAALAKKAWSRLFADPVLPSEEEVGDAFVFSQGGGNEFRYALREQARLAQAAGLPAVGGTATITVPRHVVDSMSRGQAGRLGRTWPAGGYLPMNQNPMIGPTPLQPRQQPRPNYGYGFRNDYLPDSQRLRRGAGFQGAM